MEILRLFNAPVFADEEKTQRAQVLHFVIWSLLLVADTQFFVFFFLMPERWPRVLGTLLTLNLTLPPLLILNRRGHTRQARALLMAVLWLLVTELAFTARGVHSLAILMFIVIVLIAGLLFGGKGGVIAGIVFAGTVLGLVLLERAGLLAPNRINYTALTIWVVVAMCLEFIAIFQFLANRAIKAALKLARQNAIALGQSEQRYRGVYEATSDCLFLIDVMPDGRFLGAGLNPACEKLLGVTSAESVGKTPEEVIQPKAGRTLNADMKRCVDEGIPIEYERVSTSRFGPLAGQTYYLHSVLIPMKDAEGRIFRILGVAHNVTKQKKAEAALSEREQRYREVFETASDNIFLLDVTPDGEFHFNRINPASEKVLGLTTEEAHGKVPEQILQPDFAKAATANYKRCVEQGSTIGYEETLTPLRAESYSFYTILIPLKNAEGRVYRIVGVARNITEQKKAEEALRQSEQRYREVFETTSDVIFMLDVTADGRFLSYSFNPAAEKVIGVTSAQAAGKTLDQFFPPDLARTLNANYQRCIEKGSSIEYEERITSLSGDTFCFYTTLIPVKNGEGRIYRIVGVARDITFRKETEAELRRSHDELETRVQERTADLEKVNKELEAFSYSVSHDLRRPLRAVTGFTDLLMADYARDLPGDAQNLLSMTRESTVQMNQLVDALLKLSRVDREPLVPRPVNLASLARQIANELRAEHPKRNIDIRVADLPECMGDPALLRQVFVNLLSNAIKFTVARPVAMIEVGFKVEEGKTVYFVRDNGAGFDMSQVSRLFGVFQRLHSATEFGGTGVGLTIVRRIIHRHGGTIWAEGEVNKGATFYFTLPEREPDSDKAEGKLKLEHEAG